jgi:hypothetical protein
MATASAQTEADIWERLIHPRGTMTKDAARRILEISFSDADRERMHELAKKNRRGELSEDEESEMEHFNRVGTLLSILKVRARRVLKSSKQDA